jgi:hypothetical protein
MKQTFVFLAAGLLGTGCVVSDHCHTHTVWVGWSSFVRATPSGYGTTASCAGISRIDVYVDGAQSPASAYCSDNEVAVDLQSGAHTATVEAIGTDNYPLLRDQVSFTVFDSCANQSVDTQPSEGVVTLNYDFGGSDCVQGGSYIWFNVYDEIAGLDIAGVNGNSPNPAVYACNASFVPPFALPAGDYTLDWMEEVYYAGGGTYNVSAAHCTPTYFTVTSGVNESVPSVPLSDTSYACQ